MRKEMKLEFLRHFEGSYHYKTQYIILTVPVNNSGL